MIRSKRQTWAILPVVIVIFGIIAFYVLAKLHTVNNSLGTDSANSILATAEVQAASATKPTVEQLPQPDPANGKALFETFQPTAGTSCATCHRTDSEERLVGPGLLNVGLRAQTRVAGMSAHAYIHQSIIDPSAYVVQGYPDIMPKVWGQTFTERQIADIISYLMTLQ